MITVGDSFLADGKKYWDIKEGMLDVIGDM
jgi:hypothetical protein